jgi:hypothetical protein
VTIAAVVEFPLSTILVVCGPFGTGVLLRSPTATALTGAAAFGASAFGASAAGAAFGASAAFLALVSCFSANAKRPMLGPSFFFYPRFKEEWNYYWQARSFISQSPSAVSLSSNELIILESILLSGTPSKSFPGVFLFNSNV